MSHQISVRTVGGPHRHDPIITHTEFPGSYVLLPDGCWYHLERGTEPDGRVSRRWRSWYYRYVQRECDQLELPLDNHDAEL